MKKTFLLLFLFISVSVFAQKWGYATLIPKQNTNAVLLLDTNNAVIKQWSGLTGNNGYSSYMTAGGELWRTVSATGNSFTGGGICGRIQKIAWDGTLLFDYTISDANQCSHHDIQPLPNGNVLVIVYERKTAAQVQAAGATVNAERWSEKLIELKPTGLNSATIVWQWNLWDHLVQNLYPAKSNYQSSIVDHPELLNVNYNNTGNQKDWVHMNGVDYNAKLDQIVVSSHFLNELWVIDHSTTTAQAATHTGGNSGKGGDFLYRWGNPAAYSATGTNIFHVVHDAHWVPEDCPRAGWLGGFNNQGVSASVSAVDLFQPPWDGTKYTLTPGQAYQPATYGYRHVANGYSSNMGCSQQLPNGNMLICLATAGKVYEINAAGTQVWQYTSANTSIPKAWRYSRCYLENPKIEVLTPAPSICSGGATQLNITPTATNVNAFTYNWAPSAGLSSPTAQDPSVSGLTATTSYRVTVTTAGGCSVVDSVLVTVLPPPVADAGADVTILLGQSTTLNASGGDSYLWSTGAQNADISVTPMGTSTYTVTVTNADACTATDEVTVSVVAPINVDITASNPGFCPGGSSELSVTASGGTGNYTYTWSSIPAGFSSNLSNPVVSPSENTVYMVVVGDGISNVSGTTLITVFPLPAADAGNDVGIVIGSSAFLNASGGDLYSWSTGENTASISVAPQQTTLYTVTVTDANGCSASDMVSVIVDTNLPLEGSVSASDTEICLGDVVQLFAAPLNGTGNYAYSWTSMPAGFISDLPDPFVNPEESTVYTVEISDGTNLVSRSIEIVVNPLAPPPVIVAFGDSLISSNPSNNQWYFYGNIIVGATDQVFYPDMDGSYQVQVVDANGCPSPLSEPFEYLAPPPFSGTVSATDTEICLGEVTQLLAAGVSGTGVYTYSWSSEPAGFISDLSDPFINPEETTVYTVVITDGLNTVTQTITIVVNPLAPQPMITATGNTLSSSSPVNNQWFYYGNPIDQATDQIFNPSQDGSYQVQILDANGCPSPLSEPYEYMALPLEGSISATSTVICLGDVVQLFATALNGTGHYTYSWTSVPPGFFSDLADPFVNPEENTLYQVDISDSTNLITLSLEITVNPLAPTPSISVSGDSLISSSPINNQWFFYGNPIDQANGQVFNPTEGGSYQVQVVDANGCPSPLSDPYEYIILSANPVLSAGKWWIMPNPAVDQLSILGQFEENACSIEIWNSTGNLVLQARNTRTVSVADLASGVYLIRLNTESGSGVRKLVVLR